MKDIISEILNQSSILKCSTIIEEHEGGSLEKKILLEYEKGLKYTLHVFSNDSYERNLEQFNLMIHLHNNNFPLARPLEIGKIHGASYVIYEYLDGLSGDKYMKEIDEISQYRLGLKVGMALQKFDLIKNPEITESWYNLKKNKHYRYIEKYKQCKGRLKNDKLIIDFINQNIELMKDRPTRFQHDDLHLGNMIFSDDNFIGLIDFDLFDWGDPINEFVKIGTYSRDISVAFCIGQIHGYLACEPDEVFWKLYSLYHAMAALTLYPWIERFPDQDNTTVIRRVNTYLDDQAYFKLTKPYWYDLHSERLKKINEI